MVDHYHILEVSEQATAAEIRGAYRRLVLLTHPDRTTDPAAHVRYLAVNEAYDVLSNPVRKRYYDALLQAARQPVPPASAPRHPADRRYRPRPVWRPRGPRPDPYAAEYARYSPMARRVCQVILVLFGLILLDRLWVRQLPVEAVREREFHSFSGRNYSQTWYVIRTAHATFRTYDLSGWPDVGQPVRVAKTALLGVVTGVYDPARPSEEARLTPPGFYNFFFLLPLAMALTAAVGALPSSPDRRRVDASVMAVLLGLLTLFLLVFYQ